MFENSANLTYDRALKYLTERFDFKILYSKNLKFKILIMNLFLMTFLMYVKF
jgi:hypothetical protein